MMYVILSALLFVFPFFYSKSCFILFFSLIPLLINPSEEKYRFKDGLLWGVIVFAGLFYWCLQMLFSYKFNVMTVLFWLIGVLWFALFSGIWFLTKSFLQKKMLKKNILYDYSFIAPWLISSVLFFYFLSYGSLFFCGVIEGYPFANLFFICAQYPPLLWSLRYIGSIGALFFFVGFQIFVTLAYRKKSKKYGLIAFICIMPFLIGFLFGQSSVLSKVMPQSYFIQPWWFKSKEPMFSGYRMVSEVAKVVRKNDKAKFICMPESSFNWNIHDYYQFVEMMGQDAPGVAIGFGGHRRDGSVLKSSFFIVKDGKKVFEYDKRHLIPLMERSSDLLARLGLKHLLSQSEFFVYGDIDQSDTVEINEIEYQVYICSEFFFEAKKPKGVPVLFVCNDAWLCCDYAKQWVELFVTYFAVRYGIPVFFGSVCGKNNIMNLHN